MTIVAGPQLFHSWYTWVKPVIRAAAGTGQGVAVGGGAAVGLGTTGAAAGVESASEATAWDVGSAVAVVIMMAGGGMSRAMRPAAASGAATVGRMGTESTGKANACKGSGKRMA